MSLAALTLQQLQQLTSQHSVADDLRNSATVVSATSALVAVLTKTRQDRLAAQDTLTGWNADQLQTDFLLDLALVIFSAAALVVTGPFLVSGISKWTFLHTHTVIYGLFALLWLGLATMCVWAGRITYRRWKKLRRKKSGQS